jgi:PAS domain S-box-containing protein
MLLPFTINPPPNTSTGDPPSDPVPTPRRDEPFLLSLTESQRPPPPKSASDAPPPSGNRAALVNEEHLRAVFAASPVAIVTLDRAGVITLWNPAAESLFGWTAPEALGQTAPTEFRVACARVLGGESITSLNVLQPCKTGDTIAVRVSIAALRDARGIAYGTVAIFAPA